MIDFYNNYSLQSINTFGIDVRAKYFATVRSLDELREAIRWSEQQNLPLILVGGGSNILLRADLEAVVIKNDLVGISGLDHDKEHVWVRAMAGENWHYFVLYCINQNWGGIENLSLIPGTVGAAPMQNIGAYGCELKDVFCRLKALNKKTLEVETFSLEDCRFGYRDSVFKQELKDQYFIISVTFKLTKKHKVNTSYGAISDVLSERGIQSPSIKEVSDAVIAIRQSKLPDPKEIGNSGSFFKNPVVEAQFFERIKNDYPKVPGYAQTDGKVKLAAGWLIEQCGWKGKKVGNVGVHDKQALVLVNHGGGNGAEIEALTKDIQRSVKEKFAVEIVPEVNFI